MRLFICAMKCWCEDLSMKVIICYVDLGTVITSQNCLLVMGRTTEFLLPVMPQSIFTSYGSFRITSRRLTFANNLAIPTNYLVVFLVKIAMFFCIHVELKVGRKKGAMTCF